MIAAAATPSRMGPVAGSPVAAIIATLSAFGLDAAARGRIARTVDYCPDSRANSTTCRFLSNDRLRNRCRSMPTAQAHTVPAEVQTIWRLLGYVAVDMVEPSRMAW